MAATIEQILHPDVIRQVMANGMRRQDWLDTLRLISANTRRVGCAGAVPTKFQLDRLACRLRVVGVNALQGLGTESPTARACGLILYALSQEVPCVWPDNLRHACQIMRGAI